MRYFGFGQVAENAIQQEISARGIRIEEPPPPDEPPPWEPPPEDERPITPVIITPPPVTTIPWTPLVTEPTEDDFIDVLEPPEEKKAFVLSRNAMIGLGLGLVVLVVMMGKGTERKALPAARPTPERRALPPPGPTGKRVIVDI